MTDVLQEKLGQGLFTELMNGYFVVHGMETVAWFKNREKAELERTSILKDESIDELDVTVYDAPSYVIVDVD